MLQKIFYAWVSTAQWTHHLIPIMLSVLSNWAIVEPYNAWDLLPNLSHLIQLWTSPRKQTASASDSTVSPQIKSFLCHSGDRWSFQYGDPLKATCLQPPPPTSYLNLNRLLLMIPRLKTLSDFHIMDLLLPPFPPAPQSSSLQSLTPSTQSSTPKPRMNTQNSIDHPPTPTPAPLTCLLTSQ